MSITCHPSARTNWDSPWERRRLHGFNDNPKRRPIPGWTHLPWATIDGASLPHIRKPLRHYRDLSPRWKSCFFDSVDCHTADTLIKGAFRRNNIKWPGTDDQLENYISGILQVENFLR